MIHLQGKGVSEMKAACHKEIRSVAQAAAGELYDSLMSASNELFLEWQRQNPGLSSKALESRFIAKNWSKCIDFARGTLAHMLTRPDISEDSKEHILEVLILDNSVPVGRTPPSRAVQITNLAEVWKP